MVPWYQMIIYKNLKIGGDITAFDPVTRDQSILRIKVFRGTFSTPTKKNSYISLNIKINDAAPVQISAPLQSQSSL